MIEPPHPTLSHEERGKLIGSLGSGTLGWFAVMQNESNPTNRNPIADAGPDHTESYAGQFGEEVSELDAYRSSDPDLHEPARFEWRNAAKPAPM